MRSGKDIDRVSLERMTRVFVGVYTPTSRNESWIEVGNLVQGVQLGLTEMIETDGDGNAAERTGFWDIDGTAQPAQNDPDDYAFYDKYLAGKQNFAFWCADDNLWFFKTYSKSGGKYIDNRISIFPKTGYESPRQAEIIKFGGLIGGFEIARVKNFTFKPNTNGYGKLTFDRLRTKTYGNLTPEVGTPGGSITGTMA